MSGGLSLIHSFNSRVLDLVSYVGVHCTLSGNKQLVLIQYLSEVLPMYIRLSKSLAYVMNKPAANGKGHTYERVTATTTVAVVPMVATATPT